MSCLCGFCRVSQGLSGRLSCWHIDTPFRIQLLRADNRDIHEVLRQEPNLKFIGANHFAHQEIVCPVVACVRNLSCCRPGFLQNDFVGLQQPGELHARLLTAAGRAGDKGGFSDVSRHGDADAAQKLDPLSDGIHEFHLLIVVFVEQQV